MICENCIHGKDVTTDRERDLDLLSFACNIGLMGEFYNTGKCDSYKMRLAEEANLDEITEVPKSCPFCGKEPRILYFDEEMVETHYGERVEYGGINCDNCRVTMVADLVMRSDMNDLIRKWNERR